MTEQKTCARTACDRTHIAIRIYNNPMGSPREYCVKCAAEIIKFNVFQAASEGQDQQLKWEVIEREPESTVMAEDGNGTITEEQADAMMSQFESFPSAKKGG